jgi:segregation and condensation protein B
MTEAEQQQAGRPEEEEMDAPDMPEGGEMDGESFEEAELEADADFEDADLDEAAFLEGEDAEDNRMDAPEYDHAQQLRILEAVLFASAEPLTPHAMRERLPENADMGGLLQELQAHYEGRGVSLVEIDGSWAFRTAADLGDALKIEKDVQRKLSRAAMETLAIIAYHQPVTRAEIENIRGVATNRGTLDVLLESGWVRPGRRRETPGRPLTWMTTTSFLDHFGLETLMELPGLDELKASGLLDRRPALETLPGTGDLFGEGEAQGEGGDSAAQDAGDAAEEDDWEAEFVAEGE